jgi:hypothetical protein
MTRIRELFGTRTFSYRVFLTSVVTFLHQRASQKRFFQFFFSVFISLDMCDDVSFDNKYRVEINGFVVMAVSVFW